jgi:polysaccharide export outer membrane protein
MDCKKMKIITSLSFTFLFCVAASAFQQPAPSAAPAPVFPTIEIKSAAQEAAKAPSGKAEPAVKPAEPSIPAAASVAPPKENGAGWVSYSADGKTAAKPNAPQDDGSGDDYVLGPEDSLNVRVVHLDELGDAPYPIDLRGNVSFPRIGRVHAAGKTVEQLESELTQRYKEYLQDPVVNVSVAEFHSQPISILGAVKSPGVHQIKGNSTLFEVISEAGGLSDVAGSTITITRKMTNGPLPLPNASNDPSGKYSVADLNIRSVMSARNPAQNIPVRPYDVITVPKADLVYVIGSVKKPGGFLLQERANMTVLEALALAQGLERTASAGKAKILRTDEITHARVEIPVDVKKMMEGKLGDTSLLANDILFVPTSNGKAASYRALEALVQTGTGIAVYRP